MDRINRKIIQFLVAIGTNSYFQGFIQGRIYRGSSKSLCVPGLNCYSCPGALGSCPIGSLQAVVADIGYDFSFYVVGFLSLVGIALGRFVCGWLCPFGLIQELLNKIPSAKIKPNKSMESLIYLKYLVLAVFVIILPTFLTDEVGLGQPTFCKYICPAGTLEAGIPLIITNPTLRAAAGILFRWKLAILLVTIFLSVLIFRPFCRWVCPLGAIYALFNPVSIYGLEIDEEKCNQCRICVAKCPLDIPVLEQPNSPECIRCGRCVSSCPTDALKRKFSL